MNHKKSYGRKKRQVSNNLSFIKQTDKDESQNQIHETSNIEEKRPIKRKKTRKIQCYNCRKRGHVMKNCLESWKEHAVQTKRRCHSQIGH